MNLLSRLILSSPSSTKHLFYLHPISINALHHCNFYSTKAASTIDKAQQLPKPRIYKSTPIYPKPGQIYSHEKAVSFVNLIGNVKIPVRFETDSEGKHFTATVISLGSLSIPVVFEGELAHVVACHVKENDRIFVSGQLSVEPLRWVLSESAGKFHVVAENINFVLDRNSGVEADHDHGHGHLSGVEFDSAKGNSCSTPIESNAVPLYEAETVTQSVAVESGNSSNVSVSSFADQTFDLWTNLVKNPLQWWDYRGHKTNGLVKEKFPDFKHKETGAPLWISSAPKWVFPALGMLEFDVKEIKSDKQSANLDDSWKNLVENPGKWWDNRAKKKNSKAPDFRHKETGEALWLSSSPDWALSKLPPPVNTA